MSGGGTRPRPTGDGGGREGGSTGVLGTLFRCEIRMLLRDTRTVLLAVVAPIVIFPAYILILNFVESRERRALEETTYTYAITGTEEAWATELVRAALALDTTVPDTTRAPATFELRTPDDPEEALARGDLHLVVEWLTVAEWDSLKAAALGEALATAESAADSARALEVDPNAPPSVPALRLLYRAESDFSRQAHARLSERIKEVRGLRRDSAYRGAGVPVAMNQVAPVDTMSVATAAKEAGAFLGVALTPLLVLLMLSGGSIVAVDAISGEKERGTLETLLTTGASRRDIVQAKLLAVVAVGLAVAVINVANLLVYLVLGLLDLPASMAVEVGPLELALLLLLFVPVTLLVAAALLLLSGASKSYREYQVYAFPLFLGFLVPAGAASLPGIDLHSVIALVPLAGVAVAVREILVGELDPPFLLLAFLSTAGLALWLARLTRDTLSNEKLISGAELDAADLAGGPALFPRHVVRWFLVLWVILFIVSLWFGTKLGVRGQLVVNLLGIFFGGSLLMVRRYRLDPVQAFGLRAPHPAAWAAVLIGAPSALILGMGVAQLVNTYVFPVPERMLESFGQQIMVPDLPLWQVVLFLSVMPGIFEELAFRGVLLHGLRQRLRNPWLLALTVGGIFAFFHVSLFRLVPTAWLGFVFAWVVLLTGSVYPAMLWHALNNALAIIPSRQGWVPQGFELDGSWTAPAAVGLAVAFWILWRSGPGSKRGDPPMFRRK